MLRFWDTVVAVALRTPRPAREILTSMAADRSGLLLDFELDDRPVVSGLRQILEVLDRLEPEASSDFAGAAPDWDRRSLVIAVRTAERSHQNKSNSCSCWQRLLEIDTGSDIRRGARLNCSLTDIAGLRHSPQRSDIARLPSMSEAIGTQAHPCSASTLAAVASKERPSTLQPANSPR